MTPRMNTCALVLWLAVCIPSAGCEREDVPRVGPPQKQDVQAELTYVLADTWDSGMDELNGLALDTASRVYLAGSGGVRVIDWEGNEVRTFALGDPVQCVALDAEGNAYVGRRAKVERYDRDGDLLASWGEEGGGPGQFSFITGIAVSGSDVYVADAGNRVVHRFDTTGDFIGGIGAREPDEDAPGLLCPSPHLDCAVDAEGVLHVNNPGLLRVERYRADGEPLGWWGEPGMQAEAFCGCCNPTDIALMPDGRTVTAEKGIPRVKVYDGSGRMLAHIGRENFSLRAAGMDVAVDSRGRIYVADPGDGKVRVFAPAQ